ncbi:helix-turn-helix domain-containing protein [Morganella morganii]|uniref:helix-turn-helix domain-containing protein n=1 Tax=Morganella morganii TaxID=582 RepID=UPI0034E4CC17
MNKLNNRDTEILRLSRQTSTLLFCVLESSSEEDIQSLIEMALEKNEAIKFILNKNSSKPCPECNDNKSDIQPTETTYGCFPQRLKHAMKVAGLTQKELAERAGVSQGFVSKLATGKTTDSRNIYIKLIADALGVSFGWLHYGTGEMYPTNFSADNREV